MDDLSKAVVSALQEWRKGPQQPLDVLELIEQGLMLRREALLEQVLSELLEADPTLFQDPNPILGNLLPTVDSGLGKVRGPIGFDDLWSRNPLPAASKQRLRQSTVGFVGFGGIQLCALTLARAGVGGFILADHDAFETTNANRQALCCASTVGKKKVVIGQQAIEGINAECSVTIHADRCTAADLPRLYDSADVLVDGTGDIHLRVALHEYARGSNKPIACWAWAGFEGQSTVFMPDDPLYTDAFSYSPYSSTRGFHSAGLTILNGYVAQDVENLLLRQYNRVIAYPLLMTYSLYRRNLAVLRSVHDIRKSHGLHNQER